MTIYSSKDRKKTLLSVSSLNQQKILISATMDNESKFCIDNSDQNGLLFENNKWKSKISSLFRKEGKLLKLFFSCSGQFSYKVLF